VIRPVSENLAPLQDEQRSQADIHSDDTKDGPPAPKSVPRSVPDLDDDLPSPSVPTASNKSKDGAAGQLLRALGKRLSTLAIALVAILAALVTWQHYVTAPWTRDGVVRVQVANVAPQVSGQINHVRVVDNQFVRKGDVLYTIEAFDFEVAQRTGVATAQQRAADLQVKEVQSARRQHLSNLATTPEEQQIFAGNAIQAKAALDVAQQQLAQAEINLKRAKVLSPVNGYVTNLLMRVGDFAHAGTSNISIIDADSYWIDGYFEETKMARICVGDRAEAKLMGYSQPIIGHVETVTRGISVSNAAAGTQGLPNVDPIFTWVRLAQRVPVRFAIDKVPPGVPLVSGMTATVTIRPPTGIDHRNWFDRTRAEVADRLSELFKGPPPRPNCWPTITTRRAPTETLPAENVPPPVPPDQINPGLAPDMNLPPRNYGVLPGAEPQH
jgi:multidrug resistance efflux pump